MSKEMVKISLHAYEADGNVRESVGGPMGYEELRDLMLDMLRAGRIPVVRAHGKHAALEDIIRKPRAAEPADTKPAEMQLLPSPHPMSLSIQVEGMRFAATGRCEDVLEAQAEFLDHVMED